MTPRATKAQPIARIKKSAGMIVAQTSFTVPAYINKTERKTNAIPAIVSPLILPNVNFFHISAIKMITRLVILNSNLRTLKALLPLFPCE